MKKSNNAFAGLGDVLGAGFGDLMTEGDQFAEVDLNEITVKPQVRESFEDEENTLADMEASIRKHKVFQPILIRPVEGGPRPYELVAGERRYIGSGRAGKTNIPALIRSMTDEEARDMQLAENIQRKNLTQIEEAKRIQEDLDLLGSVDAVLEKHSKGRAWLSKILSLLTLPEQAKRLISEKVSADLEVINSVKTIEKLDPAAAKALVDDLKKTRGKEDARKKTNAVKEKVKPASPKKLEAKIAKGRDGGHGAPSGSRVEGHPGEPQIFASAKTGSNSTSSLAFSSSQMLNAAYTNIFEHGSSAKTIYDVMTIADREAVEDWLHSYYDAGTKAEDTGRAVIQGFRNGRFASDGEGAFALIAFLQGAEPGTTFNLLNVLGCVKE